MGFFRSDELNGHPGAPSTQSPEHGLDHASATGMICEVSGSMAVPLVISSLGLIALGLLTHSIVTGFIEPVLPAGIG